MKEFVSKWVQVISFVAPVSVILAVLLPSGRPWLSIAWVGLAFSTAFLLRMRPTPSPARVIAGLDAEPRRAVAGSITRAVR